LIHKCEKGKEIEKMKDAYLQRDNISMTVTASQLLVLSYRPDALFSLENKQTKIPGPSKPELFDHTIYIHDITKPLDHFNELRMDHMS